MWEEHSNAPSLSKIDVHVWKFPLNQPRTIINCLAAHLSGDETERAARFHFLQGKDHYIIARGVLRALLGGYLAISPAQVTFTYSAHGKPSLDESHGSDVSFNLTHSGALALIAVTRNARIGVDIEQYRPDFEGLRIADRFFAPQECAYLRAQPETCRAEAFIRQWTRKESFIKGRGEGLSYPLNAFHVLDGDSSTTIRLTISDDPIESARWTIRDLHLTENFAGALAVERDKPEVALFACDVEAIALK